MIWRLSSDGRVGEWTWWSRGGPQRAVWRYWLIVTTPARLNKKRNTISINKEIEMCLKPHEYSLNLSVKNNPIIVFYLTLVASIFISARAMSSIGVGLEDYRDDLIDGGKYGRFKLPQVKWQVNLLFAKLVIQHAPREKLI